MKVLAVLAVLVLIGFAWTTRFEYFDNGQSRVDRWTGRHEKLFCHQSVVGGVLVTDYTKCGWF